MKVNQTRGITASRSNSTKKTGDGKFSALFSSELEATDTTEGKTQDKNKPSNQEQQPRQLVEQATELLDQALIQIESGEHLDDATLASIQQLNQHLQGLAKEDPNAPILTEAETLLAVEAKRIQSLQQH